jgi:agmatine deiminase
MITYRFTLPLQNLKYNFTFLIDHDGAMNKLLHFYLLRCCCCHVDRLSSPFIRTKPKCLHTTTTPIRSHLWLNKVPTSQQSLNSKFQLPSSKQSWNVQHILEPLGPRTQTTRTMSSINSDGDSDEYEDSYFMPAEWTPHAACLMLYPHNPATFRLPLAQAAVRNIARAIAKAGKERVVLFCKSPAQAAQLQKDLQNENESSDDNDNNNDDGPAEIIVKICPSNDTWARDTGPTFVMSRSRTSTISQRHSHLQGLNWEFNAYGGPEEGCYWPCELDRKVALRMCRELSSDDSPDDDLHQFNLSDQVFDTIKITHSIPLMLEGGSIHTDGQGTILTTKECLLHSNRNPEKSQQEIQDIVLRATGCTKMIWLDTGLACDDDTNGHIDNFACFVQPAVVVLAWTEDATHDAENYRRCRAALHILESETDASGRPLTVHKLYLPSPMVYSREEVDSLQTTVCDDGTMVAPRQIGEPMAASYVNFYIANAAVIVPQFGDTASDAKALETLGPLFPDRQVVGVASREVLLGGGNIHCITQQIPAC